MGSEELFILGFNSGYILTKYEPELSDKVSKVDGAKDDYFNGLLSGRSEYLLEKAKEKLKSQNKTIQKKKNRGRSKN